MTLLRRSFIAAVLLAMGVAQILGILAYGPMDRLLRSRKKVVLGVEQMSAERADAVTQWFDRLILWIFLKMR